MAQAEDTELRDLVVEALEKNGSLAKIRALLRANIFLAFEDDCENLKQNESLDKVLNLPEGKLSLCIIHEFLEFCNLKNTLFVYMSETRQGKEYSYKKDDVLEKLNVPKLDRDKEPILLTIVKNVIKSYPKKHFNVNEKHRTKGDNNIKEEQNCTYIVHEDSSSSSQSQSDNSSDEKNKINLRLPLDNSDTDTSSDSARDKNSSEYIPNSQNFMRDNDMNKSNILQSVQRVDMNCIFGNNSDSKRSDNLHDLKNFNSSNESTSYMELKPVSPLDKVLINTTGLPLNDNNTVNKNSSQTHSQSSGSQNESISSMQTLSSNSNKLKNNDLHNESPKKILQKTQDDSGLNDTETMEYSYDFSPPFSEHKSVSENIMKNSESIQTGNNTSPILNNSVSSPSSISTSDVADLLSEKSYKSFSKDNKNDSNKSRLRNSNRNIGFGKDHSKLNSDNSSDFSESSVPSLSNLSLEIHSE